MKFVCDNVVRLVAVKEITSKSGNKLVFVKVADTTTYENCEFMLDVDKTDLGVLSPMSDYDMILDVEGKFSKVVLAPLARK